MGATAPKQVSDLVDRFDRDRKACPERSRRVFLSPDYKEEQLRAEFLNPFFTALGRDGAKSASLTWSALNLAKLRLRQPKQSPKTKMPREQEPLECRNAATGGRIDALSRNLCGRTEEEMMVDGGSR